MSHTPIPQSNSGQTPTTPAGGGNQNQQVQQTGGTPPDNTGVTEESLANFWDEEAPSNDGQQPSNQGGQQQQSGQQPPADTNQMLDRIVQSMNLGDGISEDIVESLGQGDTKPFNEYMLNANRAMVRQVIMATGQMIAGIQRTVDGRVQQQVQDALKSRDTQDFVNQEFQVKDPLVQPIVQAVYDKALNNTKGDRKKAAAQARLVLGKMGYNVGKGGGEEQQSQQQEDARIVNWAKTLGLTG